MNRILRWFPLLLLGALAALTFWLDQTAQPGQKPSGKARHDPDYIVDRIVAKRFAPNGEIKHTLHAERMVHYADDDSTHLVAPRFVSYATVRAPVTITSRTAVVSSEGENVYFEGDVRASRAAYADRSELVLQTTYLHVIPDKHLARTDRAVTITDAHTVAHAIGLELNSETRTVNFLSQFRGTYHDPARSAAKR